MGTTLPNMVPYDSQYWEMSGKIGLNKKFNATDVNWTFYGAGILSADSDNKYKIHAGLIEHYEMYDGGDFEGGGMGVRDTMKGDVSGYRVGSDLWIRHHVNECLSLPFLVGVGYTKKDRDGNGSILFYEYESDPGGLDYDIYNLHVNLKYKDVLRTPDIKVGGGLSVLIGK